MSRSRAAFMAVLVILIVALVSSLVRGADLPPDVKSQDAEWTFKIHSVYKTKDGSKLLLNDRKHTETGVKTIVIDVAKCGWTDVQPSKLVGKTIAAKGKTGDYKGVEQLNVTSGDAVTWK